MTDSPDPGQSRQPKTFRQLQEEFQTAVVVAETIPCPESWARVEAARLALSNTQELRFARAAINRRDAEHAGAARNIPGAHRW